MLSSFAEYFLEDKTFPDATFIITIKLVVQELWATNKTPSGLNYRPLMELLFFYGNPFAQYIFALLEIDIRAIYGNWVV
jgi:hypothetical protein